VYTFTKLHERRISNVGVGVRIGVGAVEFQLKWPVLTVVFLSVGLSVGDEHALWKNG